MTPEEAYKLGYQLGYWIGFQEGFKQGQKEAKQQVAIRMLKLNFTVEEIMDITELAAEEIVMLSICDVITNYS